ncbi:MAG: FkbM family methyltransferase [Acidobacteria bacterium]|nr:FkbM family methyltransferase [Acidobacteriota bacterium]
MIRKLALLLLLLVLPLAFYKPARLGAIAAIGFGQGCTFDQALHAAEHSKQLRLAKDRILAGTKKVKDEPPYALYETPDGPYWIPVRARGEFALPFNIAEEEVGIYSAGSVHIKEGDIVLDCGANVGIYTRRALKQGARIVVAIEPAPQNVEVLKRNFASEIEQGRVIIYPKGVWDKDDLLVLHQHSDNSAADSFVINQEEGKADTHASDEKLPLTTIDKLVAELKLDRVDFIKMDIEGAEVRAIQGGSETIAKFHPRMALSTYHQADHPVEVPKAVYAAWSGYRTLCGPCTEVSWRVRPDVLLFH